jgi:hypothetical protein
MANDTSIRTTFVLALCACFALWSDVSFAQGITGNRPGQGGSVIRGSAGPDGGAGIKGLETCENPLAAVAVVEPQDHVMQALTSYRLGSPTGLIRMMIQQSNCFIVVERGVAMQNAMQERALAARGELRQDSNVGGGQMMTADFILTPAIVFSENNAGAVGSTVAGLFGRRAATVAGNLSFKEAQTSMLLADARTTVQVASAEGSTRKADLRVGSGIFTGVAAGAAGGYGSTNEGKIIAAALLDNYNNIVKVVRNDPSTAQYNYAFDPSLGTYARRNPLQRDVGTLAQEAAAGGEPKPAGVFNEGDVVAPKIAGVKIMAEPSDDAKAVATLGATEQVVVVGSAMNGFVKVQGASGAGWVKILLVSKR